jgi:hypothetical protein
VSGRRPTSRSVRCCAAVESGVWLRLSSIKFCGREGESLDIDVKACARCGARMDVRAVVTDHEVARKIFDAMPSAARAPPSADSTIAYEPAFA